MKRQKGIWYEHLNPSQWKEEYPECSMYEYLRDTSQRYPNLIAIEFEGRKYSYRQLLSHIENTAHALVSLGVGVGDVVSVVTPNIPQALFMIYAVNRVGGIVNMIHPLLSTTEIQRFIEDTNSVAVLTLDVIYPKFSNIEWNMKRTPTLILARVVDALPRYAKPFYSLKNKCKLEISPSHNVCYWRDFLSMGRNVNLPFHSNHCVGDDTAVILYSGGTSGTPKGVMLTNRNINALALHTYDIGGIENVIGKRSLAVMPLFHGFGLVICVHAMICQGFHVYLVPKYDFKICTDLIFKKKINCIYGVPGLYEALSRSTEIETKDLSFMELLVCGGDKLPEKLQKRMNAHLKKGGANVVLREAYGQTECVAGCSINPKFDTRIGSAGIAYPDVEFKIVELGTEKELPVEEPGELCVSGPIVMKGYFNDEDATRCALREHSDGKTWLHTGDVFSMDRDGYIYFKQRSSRMLICGGYNIYSTQVEDAICTCPAVAQCCVVGIRDRIYGQKIGAYVVLNNPDADQHATRENIMKACRKLLAEYSMPHEIFFRDCLPVTNLGKVDYLVLESEINRKRGNNYAGSATENL